MNADTPIGNHEISSPLVLAIERGFESLPRNHLFVPYPVANFVDVSITGAVMVNYDITSNRSQNWQSKVKKTSFIPSTRELTVSSVGEQLRTVQALPPLRH